MGTAIRNADVSPPCSVGSLDGMKAFMSWPANLSARARLFWIFSLPIRATVCATRKGIINSLRIPRGRTIMPRSDPSPPASVLPVIPPKPVDPSRPPKLSPPNISTTRPAPPAPVRSPAAAPKLPTVSRTPLPPVSAPSAAKIFSVCRSAGCNGNRSRDVSATDVSVISSS